MKAELSGTNLEAAVYNIMTRWPEGFDHKKVGARLCEKKKHEELNKPKKKWLQNNSQL